jgi:ABC-type Fe3+ transport system permease subunit
MNCWLKKSLITAVRLVAIGVMLGWLYAWASPWAYPREGKLGFGHGCVHGALMPMALPSLVMGNDVEIFAANNSGRGYKLGYIIGINVCGLVFFGSAFWSPKKKVAKE